MADSIADDVLAAQNLERAIKLRHDGANWIEVAKACDYPNARAALVAVGAAMAEATARADMTADQHRDEANLRLEHLLGETLAMLRADAPEAYDSEGNPITPDDRAVKLRAVDEARRLIESKLKINGVTPPKAEDESKGIPTIRIIGLDPKDII